MKVYLSRLIFILVFLFYTGYLFAQTITVTGNVKDFVDNSPLPGVTILVKGTTAGTISDLDGNYSITLASDATLVFSFVGYSSVEVAVAGRTTINIFLAPTIEALSELVVIGYGTQKKKVVTGAIATIKPEEITSTSIFNIAQAMQGRAAGVQVTNQSGQPGEGQTVRIRGTGTTGYADPLYIVDGLAVYSIDYLNPGDIESIDVLKDAASAAIYGARAANGVILITTKSGKKGDLNVTFSSYQGIQNTAKTIDMLDADQYRMIWNESLRNSNQTEVFDLNEIPKYNTNWQDHLFTKNAPIANHELSVSGGTDKSTYSSSLSYFSQQGIIGGPKSQFDRITARINSRHKVTNWFEFGSNLAYSQITRRGIASNSSFNSAYGSALNMDPLTPLYEKDEVVLNAPPYSNNPVVKSSDGMVYGISQILVSGEVINPMALLEIQNARSRGDRFVGNVFGEFKIIEGLSFNTSLGLDLAYSLGDSYRPFFYLNSAQRETEQTSVSKSIDRAYTWQVENLLRYSRNINDHNFSALLGTTARKEFLENLYGFNTDVPINDPVHVYLNLATGSNWQAFGGASHSALLSVFGRITYDYKNKYSFTGILRRDGSSRFGENRRFGTFPSVGVSWVISDEDFIPDLGPVNFLKFRAAYGVNGNEQIGDYQFISVMNNSRSYIFGGGRLIGASPDYIENADIKWEQSEQINFAYDIGAFNNRLTATIDYYIKTTKGLLEIIPILAHVGNNPPYANVGSVQNKGIEMSFNWRNVTKNFRYSLGLNAAYNKNKMIKVGNEEGVVPGGGSWAVAGFVTRTELGYPIAYFWGYKTDGIFQNQAEIFQHIGSTGAVLQPNAKPGDVRFVDVNKDGKIDDFDRTFIGNPTPDWTFGMNGSLEYKQFDVSFLLVGTYGNDVFNGAQRRDLYFLNRSTAILDRWTPENPSKTTPRVVHDDINRNNRVSDLYIEDGSFLRVKNVQIGYTLPESIQNRIRSKNVRFYISAENLFTFTRYTGADPEIGVSGNSFDIGIDRGIYPQARTWRLGTTITF